MSEVTLETSKAASRSKIEAFLYLIKLDESFRGNYHFTVALGKARELVSLIKYPEYYVKFGKAAARSQL